MMMYELQLVITECNGIRINILIGELDFSCLERNPN
jgi:hypothetical protein